MEKIKKLIEERLIEDCEHFAQTGILFFQNDRKTSVVRRNGVWEKDPVEFLESLLPWESENWDYRELPENPEALAE